MTSEVLKYVGDAYPKGVCSVCCTNGKDVEGSGVDFQLVVVISAVEIGSHYLWWVLTILKRETCSWMQNMNTETQRFCRLSQNWHLFIDDLFLIMGLFFFPMEPEN